MRITNIGHATLLVELGGVRVLTDPNFDSRLAGVLRRVSGPGLSWKELPRPDAVLLTHAHADHLSLDSLRVLEGVRRGVPIYAPPGVARWLITRGHPCARSISPGGSISIEGSGGAVKVYAGSATHQGSRYGFDRWGGRGAANTYLIDSGDLSLFFAGDTALTPESPSLVLERLGSRARQLDVALLPIGYAPWWKPGFRRGHLSPGDALTLFERLSARLLIPYHWGTFHHLTSGPFDALRQLESHLASYPRRSDVRIVAPGESVRPIGHRPSAIG